MSDLELQKGKTKVGKQDILLYLFENTKQNLNTDLENLIGFSVIYRSVGLRYEITEIISIIQNHHTTEG